jgi:hypothetical protein
VPPFFTEDAGLVVVTGTVPVPVVTAGLIDGEGVVAGVEEVGFGGVVEVVEVVFSPHAVKIAVPTRTRTNSSARGRNDFFISAPFNILSSFYAFSAKDMKRT